MDTTEKALSESVEQFVEAFKETSGQSERTVLSWKNSLTRALAILQCPASATAKAFALAELQQMAMTADAATAVAARNQVLVMACESAKEYCKMVGWINFEGNAADDAPDFVHQILKLNI